MAKGISYIKYEPHKNCNDVIRFAEQDFAEENLTCDEEEFTGMFLYIRMQGDNHKTIVIIDSGDTLVKSPNGYTILNAKEN